MLCKITFLILLALSRHVLADDDFPGDPTSCKDIFDSYKSKYAECKITTTNCADIHNACYAKGGRCESETDSCRKTSESCLEKQEELREKSQLCSEQSRLTAYRPNTVALDFSQGDKNPALEVIYSFKYMFTKPDCYYETDGKAECIEKWPVRTEIFFSYTGKFDFYWLELLPSSPVVNRISNPALHVRMNYVPDEKNNLEWIDFGVEHRSNGQVTSAYEQDSAGKYIAEQKWQGNDIAYINGISRGSNFFSLEGKHIVALGKKKGTNWLSAKLYLSEDTGVTWGNGKYRDHKIWHYDFIREVFEWQPVDNIPKLVSVVEYTIGLKGFATHSMNASLTYNYSTSRRETIPYFVKIHIGPMNELSNYTVPQRSLFFGISLNPYPERR